MRVEPNVTFIVDASVAIAWSFEDEEHAGAEAALQRLAQDEAAVAPELWRLEVANVLLIAERRGRMNEFQAARALARLWDLPIDIDRMPPEIESVLTIGRKHGLSAYDATYLTLAERRGLPLATLDKGLRKAARTAGVPLLIDE